jgi:hypothetical protein
LLPVLARRKPLTRRLLELPSWQKLADAFATRQAALSLQLSQKLQRALSRSLCLAASGFAEQGQAQQYVSHLLLQTAKDITGLAGQEQRQLAAAAERADVQLQVRTADTVAPFSVVHMHCSPLLSAPPLRSFCHSMLVAPLQWFDLVSADQIEWGGL